MWQSGGTPSRSNKSYYGGNIPWLKTGDLNDGLITNIPEGITEEAVTNSSAKINPTGSVLMAMYGATIGKLGILTFPATTNQACCACIEYYAITQYYLFYFLLSHRDIFIAKGGGGAQPNISKEIIVNTAIPLPPLPEQERIIIEIERWFAFIDEIEQKKPIYNLLLKRLKARYLIWRYTANLCLKTRMTNPHQNCSSASIRVLKLLVITRIIRSYLKDG
ncbi:restriction endonuclease subunit S [Phocaeicola plebeius]|uniref:restriction endonuclease subunit S n=1 Tax=Phocaeicola plebeius TaxID=310297 RepID=UPI00217620F6|nr:restriction endonuclease subunit S [Phocaeicola plebeius]